MTDQRDKRDRQDDERPATAGELARFFDGISFRALAGSAALFLGAIYAYGTIVKAGELRGADQSVGDTLPLVPLEQLLVLGINSVLPLAAAAIVLLLVLMVAMAKVTEAVSKAEKEGKARRKERKRKWKLPRWLAWAILGAWFVFALLTTQAVGWILFAQMFAGSWYARSRHTTPRANLLFVFFAVSITLASMAYFTPAPLPDVRMETYEGRKIQGELIATTGDTWYLATSENKWTAIQSRAIQKVDVKAGEKEQSTSLFEEITGENLLGLGP